MNRFRVVALLVAVAGLGVVPFAGRAQTPAGAGSSSLQPSSSPSPTIGPEPKFTYTRPSEKTKLRNYLFDTLGPYPVAGAMIAGGITQADNTPPEWGQGAEAYGQRVGSAFGIALVTTTTRYGLAKAFREDTIYYRCECKGFMRRLGHAMISTVTARHGEDGRRRLSFPAIVAPYAGSMTAVYGWYPDRYSYKDGFRMGNVAFLAFVGGNVAREFIYGGPHTLFRRVNRTAPPDPAASTNP